MKNISENILTNWIAWEVGGIDKEHFFKSVDEYILISDEPEFYILELTSLHASGRNEIREYFAKHILDLEYGATNELRYELICSAYKKGLLDIKQASQAISRYLVDDEWGSIDSPNSKLNVLYDKWAGGRSTIDDAAYYVDLENVLLRS